MRFQEFWLRMKIAVPVIIMLMVVLLPSAALGLPIGVLTDPDDGLLWDNTNITNIKENTPRITDTSGELMYLDEGEGWDPPWIDEGYVYPSFGPFDFRIWNKAHDDIDGMVLLIAYRGSATFSFDLTYGANTIPINSSEQFKPLTGGSAHEPYVDVFDGSLNRPGDGQTALYTSSTGVVFVDLGSGEEHSALLAGETLDMGFDFTELSGASEDFLLHFNVYGYSDLPAKSTTEYTVWCTNPNSGDLTVGPPIPEASTMLLFGSGLLGVLGFARRKARSLVSR